MQSRLVKLYPEYEIVHMPSMGRPPEEVRAAEILAGSDGAGGAGKEAVPPTESTKDYTATSFVANAATYGSAFQWHVDADPSSLPPSEWLRRYGDYVNGQPGKPLFVSLLVYLDAEWRKEWDAETLFLSEEPGVGLLVQPRPGRCVLMHQDVLHRVSTPSLIARRPRYSLVWKLLFVPKSGAAAAAAAASRPQPAADEGSDPNGVSQPSEIQAGDSDCRRANRRHTICRPEWGSPTRLG